MRKNTRIPRASRGAHTRFPRIARALTFDLERAPKKCTQLTPLSRRLILLSGNAGVKRVGDFGGDIFSGR